MTKNGNPSDADIIADALDTFHPGCAANWPIVQAVVTALANRAASRPAQEPTEMAVAGAIMRVFIKKWFLGTYKGPVYFDCINGEMSWLEEARAVLSLTGETSI